MAVTLLAPTGNFGSQLDRAICAYLIAQGCGTAGNISPANSQPVNAYPTITVKSFSSEQDPVLTGRESYQVQIQCKTSAATETNDPNPAARAAQSDALVGQVMAAMLQSDDQNTLDYTARAITTAGRALATGLNILPDSNNADMLDFTLDHLYWIGTQRGEPDDDGSAWVEIRTFKCNGSPSNTD